MQYCAATLETLFTASSTDVPYDHCIFAQRGKSMVACFFFRREWNSIKLGDTLRQNNTECARIWCSCLIHWSSTTFYAVLHFMFFNGLFLRLWIYFFMAWQCFQTIYTNFCWHKVHWDHPFRKVQISNLSKYRFPTSFCFISFHQYSKPILNISDVMKLPNWSRVFSYIIGWQRYFFCCYILLYVLCFRQSEKGNRNKEILTG